MEAQRERSSPPQIGVGGFLLNVYTIRDLHALRSRRRRGGVFSDGRQNFPPLLSGTSPNGRRSFTLPCATSARPSCSPALLLLSPGDGQNRGDAGVRRPKCPDGLPANHQSSVSEEAAVCHRWAVPRSHGTSSFDISGRRNKADAHERLRSGRLSARRHSLAAPLRCL